MDIYIDESGNFAPYTKQNPIYSVSFIFAEDRTGDGDAIGLGTFHVDAETAFQGDADDVVALEEGGVDADPIGGDILSRWWPRSGIPGLGG